MIYGMSAGYERSAELRKGHEEEKSIHKGIPHSKILGPFCSERGHIHGSISTGSPDVMSASRNSLEGICISADEEVV